MREKIILLLKRKWGGFSITSRNRAQRVEIPAGEHEVLRVTRPSISLLNKTRNKSISSAVYLSRKRSEPWLIITGTEIGAPEKFWLRWEEDGPELYRNEEGKGIPSWGDWAVRIKTVYPDGTEKTISGWEEHPEIIEIE